MIDNKNISTKLGVAIITIFALTALAFVLACEKNRPIGQVENNLPASNKNNPSENKTGNESTSQTKEGTISTLEEDLKKYPPMNPEEVARLTRLTKNWKTFRSEPSGYEFKYPSDYYIEKVESNNDDYIKVVSNGGCVSSREGNAKAICRVYIGSSRSNPKEDSMNELAAMKKALGENKSIPIFSIQDKIIVTNPNADTIGGSIYVQTSNNIYIISSGIVTYASFAKLQPIIQGIYFTLKEIN
jgi:hypothetical protein